MAGDWIPMRLDLHEDPAVMQMATKLKCREEVVVGYLHKVWSWMSRQMSQDFVTGVTLESLGRVTNLPGFPELMSEVGWLVELHEEGVVKVIVPNFDHWLSETAKKRLDSAIRKRKSRDKSVTNVTKSCDQNVTLQDRTGQDKEKLAAITNSGKFIDWLSKTVKEESIRNLLSTWIMAIESAGKFNAVSNHFEVVKLLGNGWPKDQLVAAIENSIGGPYPKFYDQSERNGAKPTKPAMTDEERKKARSKAKIRIVAHLNEGKPENEAIAAEIAREHDIDLPGFIELIRKQEDLK